MPQVRILLRWILLATAALVVLTWSSSSSSTGPAPGGNPIANPCGSGVGDTNRNAPIVCVDDTGGTLRVQPDPIAAHSVGESDRRPVMIHWWTRSGGNQLKLDIEEGCVTDLSCRGSHCQARTLPVTERKQCKYAVWTDKHPKLDPDIVVDPCC